MLWIVVGILFLISTNYLFDLWEKNQEEDFIAKSYKYTLKIKPKKDDNSKGLYLYPCINFHGVNSIVDIGSTPFYNTVLVGDTIEKKKGVDFILLKREHLVLKVPVTFNYENKVDTVLVR